MPTVRIRQTHSSCARRSSSRPRGGAGEGEDMREDSRVSLERSVTVTQFHTMLCKHDIVQMQLRVSKNVEKRTWTWVVRDG
jgi:hypothetical protein